MSELTRIENVNLALNLIKAKEILVTYSNHQTTYFVMKKDKIFCQNHFSTYEITFQEFLELFSHTTFFIFNGYEGNVDIKKDEEYYSWDKVKK